MMWGEATNEFTGETVEWTSCSPFGLTEACQAFRIAVDNHHNAQ